MEESTNRTFRRPRQSPALRLICERDAEIEKFVQREYWSIEADLNHQHTDFMAKLVVFEDEKLQQFTIDNAGRAEQVEKTLSAAAGDFLLVSKVEKNSAREIQPHLLLHQHCSRRLRANSALALAAPCKPRNNSTKASPLKAAPSD